MTTSELAAAARWARGAQDELARTGFAQIDIDDLLDPPPPLAARAALRVMNLALAERRHTMPSVVGAVVVPLPDAEGLTLEAPGLDELLDRPWVFGPGRPVPGVYLLADASWSLQWDGDTGEEYRRTLPTTSLLPAGHAVYYRTWKSFDGDSDRPAEFGRAVYIVTPAG